jgi:hypothetical protein
LPDRSPAAFLGSMLGPLPGREQQCSTKTFRLNFVRTSWIGNARSQSFVTMTAPS